MALIGSPVSFLDALLIESLSQVIRAASLIIPGGIGTQEIGGVALCRFLGVAEPAAVTFWLLRRARELFFDVVGAVYLLRVGGAPDERELGYYDGHAPRQRARHHRPPRDPPRARPRRPRPPRLHHARPRHRSAGRALAGRDVPADRRRARRGLGRRRPLRRRGAELRHVPRPSSRGGSTGTRCRPRTSPSAASGATATPPSWRIDAPVHEEKELSLARFTGQLAESRAMLGRWLDLYQIHSATPDRRSATTLLLAALVDGRRRGAYTRRRAHALRSGFRARARPGARAARRRRARLRRRPGDVQPPRAVAAPGCSPVRAMRASASSRRRCSRTVG